MESGNPDIVTEMMRNGGPPGVRMTVRIATLEAERDRLASELATLTAQVAELRAELATARNDALDEAAKVARRVCRRPLNTADIHQAAVESAAAQIERDILAARTTEPAR